MINDYSKLFLTLTRSIDEFVVEVSKHNLSDIATPEWSVKDVLCHIAYWHRYYAENYASQAAGKDPFVFTSKGGSTRNQKGVDEMKLMSKSELISSIKKSHSSLYKSIVIKGVPQMTYIKPRTYKTEDFLEMISGHIKRHTLQIKRSKTLSL